MTLGGLGLALDGIATVRHLALGDSVSRVAVLAVLIGLVSASATLRGYRGWRDHLPTSAGPPV